MSESLIAATADAPRPWQAAAMLAAFVALVSVAWLAWMGSPVYPLDDAYITQRAAQDLFTGGERRFAEGTVLHGVTSPLHVVLVAVVARLTPVATAQAIWAVLGFALFVAAAFELASRHAVPRGWAALTAAVCAVSGLSFLHFFNGLETGLAAAGILWALVLFHDPVPRTRWAFALLGALPFIRPELGALSGLLFLRFAWAARTDLRQIAIAAACSAAAALPFCLILWGVTGSVLPATAAAKRYFFAEECYAPGHKLRIVAEGVQSYLRAVGWVAIGFLGIAFSHLRWVALGFATAFLGALALQLPGAAWHNEHRYLHVLTPLLVLGWVGVLARWPRSNAVRLALLLAVLTTVASLPANLGKYADGVAVTRRDLAPVTEWVAKNVPADAVVLVHDAGHIALQGRQTLVDIVGLKTPSSIEVHRQLTWPHCRVRNPLATESIATASGAQYLVVLTDWDRIFGFSRALKSVGWNVERADGERGRTRYVVYKIQPPTRS